MTLPELLTDLDIPFRLPGQHHHVTTGWVGIDCPTCSPNSGRFRCGVHFTGRCSCWTCGPQSFGRVLRELTGLPWAEIKRRLAEVTGEIPEEVYVPGKYKEPPRVGPLQPAHRKYLTSRGFDPDEIAEVWGVQGIGACHRLGWRLFIPVAVGTRPGSWTTRAIGEAILRYVSARPDEERTPLKHTLYGADKATHTAIVVEGPIDAWRIGPGAVAIYGAQYTPCQVALLGRYCRRVICLDRDAQGAARRLAAELSVLPGQTLIAELSGKDPDSSPQDEILELRKKFLD